MKIKIGIRGVRQVITSIVEYLYIILVIIECNTVYSCSDQFGWLPYAILVVTFMMFACKSLFLRQKKIRMERFLSLLLPYLLITGVYAMLGVSGSVMAVYISKFMVFIPLSVGALYLPNDDNSRQKFLSRFVNVICFLAASSLILWFFGSYLKLFSPNMVCRAYWARYIDFRGYFGLMFEYQYNEVIGVYRNAGIFTEGPMYSIWLVIALCFEMFNLAPNKASKRVRKRHLSKVIVLIMTIFSTMTTAGILALVTLCAYRMLGRSTNSNVNKALHVMMVIILLGAFASPMISMVTDKLNSYSGVTRIGSIMSALYAFVEHPVIGNGFNSTQSITSISNALYGRDTGISNSIFLVLAQGGIMLGSVYLVPLIATLRRGIKEHNRVLMIDCYILMFEMVVTWIPYKFALLMLISLMYVYMIDNSSMELPLSRKANGRV